jgi:peptidoglycan biosynthesis protein MviN/MurJ (putative lipid II flippase)
MRGSGKTSPTRGRSAVRSGLATGLSILAVNGSAAVAGALLAQKFGRGEDTDGFLAAYGVYLVLVLGAQAFRLVVVPDLTRAAEEARLGSETSAYAVAFCLLALPLTVLVIVFAGPLGEAITGSLPATAAEQASAALPWLVPAAFAQLFAGVAASALAARDSYQVAAVGYAAGAVAGLALFLALADSHGLVALAWGLALNGAIAVALPLWVLIAGGHLRGAQARSSSSMRRLGRLVSGAAVPLALQASYLVGLRFAADLGVGSVTTLSYAYLLAATLVAATASSLSLISSAPLTRRGIDAESAAAHVIHSSWLSLAAIAAAAGVFALVGEQVVGAVLGSDYKGEVGHELGRLVVFFSPWMLVAVAFTVTFPLLFVLERSSVLVPVALGAVAVNVPLTYGLREAFGLEGIALALAGTTLFVLVVLLASVSRRMLRVAMLGLGRLAVVQTALAAAAFGVLSFVLDGAVAAGAGLVLYAALLLAVRPHGLREAWHYVRALH